MTDALGGLLGGKNGKGGIDIPSLIEQFGGLDGIIEKLQSGGLGEQVSSWIGLGANVPVNSDQVKRALSMGGLEGIAAKAGLDVDDLVGQLANLLPKAVDKMTPNGTKPEGGFDMGALSNVLGGILADK
ncbi:MAG: YidB family protein [Acidimicrobiia bacterium]